MPLNFFLSRDGTIITGDSRGMLSFWNNEYGTLIQSIQSHKADILALALSQDSSTVFCAGIEPIVIEFKYLEQSSGVKWVRGDCKMGLHSHDVNSMVIAQQTLLSGGKMMLFK